MQIQHDTPVFFSVCIPVYNTEKFLPACIDSVLAQTEKSYEILLVDDGSRDGSGAICDGYARKHPNIRVLHKKNEGLVLARYDAVRLARGSFLTFLDSDDLYVPQTLQHLRQTLEATDADMVLFDLERFYPDGRTACLTESYADGTLFEGAGRQQLLQDFIMGNRLNSMCRKCIRRELYDARQELQDFAGVVQGEDKLASLSCMDGAKRTVYRKESLYRYRMNAQSATHTLNLKGYQDIQRIHSLVEAYIARWQLPREATWMQQLRRLRGGSIRILSLAEQRRQGSITGQTLKEAVDYVANDPVFVQCWQDCRCRLGFLDRLVCGLILRRADGVLCQLSGLVTLIRKLRRR